MTDRMWNRSYASLCKEEVDRASDLNPGTQSQVGTSRRYSPEQRCILCGGFYHRDRFANDDPTLANGQTLVASFGHRNDDNDALQKKIRRRLGITRLQSLDNHRYMIVAGRSPLRCFTRGPVTSARCSDASCRLPQRRRFACRATTSPSRIVRSQASMWIAWVTGYQRRGVYAVTPSFGGNLRDASCVAWSCDAL